MFQDCSVNIWKSIADGAGRGWDIFDFCACHFKEILSAYVDIFSMERGL